MGQNLGNWSVIDLETTGADPGKDQIIDVGFLRFEDFELVEKYSSLCRYDEPLSFFIKKLTGIDEKMLKSAPRFSDVEERLGDLGDDVLIAHNASFEASFLSPTFDRINAYPSYADSMYFLGLIYPQLSSLKLESFIRAFELRDHEVHRGFEDSLDLLKVVLVATLAMDPNQAEKIALENLVRKHALEDWFFGKFLMADHDDLKNLCDQIEFDPIPHLDLARKLGTLSREEVQTGKTNFSMEFSGQNIAAIWRDEGQLKECFPGYRHRKSQEDLSLKVGQCLKNNVHAMVQAPTGTGKTLGYLIPSALFSLAEKRQVLIATGTKTLQHQAKSKDVPMAQSMLSLDHEDLKVKTLVGSSNHFCELLHRQEEAEGESLLDQMHGFEERWSQAYLDRVFAFNAEAKGESVIMRDDIPYVFRRKLPELSDRIKNLAVDYRACTGNRCPFKSDCSYLRGLREAKEADLIIGNHALMFSWPRSFPRPAHIVVDEAHKIESEATSAFTMECQRQDLDQIEKQLRQLQGLGPLFYLLASREETSDQSQEIISELRTASIETAQMMKDHLAPLAEIIEVLFKQSPRYSSIYWNERVMLESLNQASASEVSVHNHIESLYFILQDFSEKLLPYHGRWEAKDLEEQNEIVALTRFETFVSHLFDILTTIEVALGKSESISRKDYAVSLSFHEEDGYLLKVSPIDVGRVLHDGLLATSSSVVFTSATLGNDEGTTGTKGIEWSLGYSYLDPERRFKSGFYLPSVYDYGEKTKVFLCDDVPHFSSQDFVPNVLKQVIPLIRKIEGRSLLLFSARTRFEIAREILLQELDGEIPVFVQGMGSDVVSEFKDSGQGILLGMESFGEGIDIPGDALQFVFVDKIPDLRMDHVIQKRRDFFDQQVGNEFTDYYLSHRTRSLQQKLGRLLRTESDFGGVIIVDQRTARWKGRTMETLRSLMKPYKINKAPLEEACAEVESFIMSASSDDHDANLCHPDC